MTFQNFFQKFKRCSVLIRKKAHEDFADVDRNSFTKLGRASQLLDQVLIHVYVTPPHGRFDGVEALDILISLTSFMATFQNGQLTSQPLLDSALAISRR
jgi:hypothetical protein